MADDNRLPKSMQESIATAVAIVDDDNTRIVARAIEPELFDSPLDTIITRCLDYREQYGRPPGKAHIDDIFADILENQDHKQHNLMDTLIRGMVRQSENLDTRFLAARVNEFVQLKLMRAGIAEAADKYQKGGPAVMDEIESVFRKTLKVRTDHKKDYGFTLRDSRALKFLDRDSNDSCKIGIPELDINGVHPARGELLAFLAPPNRGKSHFLHHCGKFGLLKGWNVYHITLENSDDMTAQRYFQTLFSGVKKRGNYHYVETYDDNGAVRLRSRNLKPNFVIADKDETSRFLQKQVKDWDDRLDHLRVRRYATNSLTFEMLERDLDELEVVHHFVPDMLLLDMPQLMKRDRKREEHLVLSDLFADVRGLAVERNMAAICPLQGNRSSLRASSVRADHGSGSFNVFGVADNAITYSQTQAEEQYGIARLFAEKVRNDKARYTVLITQHYDSGQFCMDSRYMTNEMRDVVKGFVGPQNSEDEEDEAEAEDLTPARKRA